MCLGVPGRVVDVAEEAGVLMGRVDFGGVARKVCLAHVPNIQVGEYVLVHVGFALSRLDEDEAKRVYELLIEIGQLEDVMPELEVPEFARPKISDEGAA